MKALDSSSVGGAHKVTDYEGHSTPSPQTVSGGESALLSLLMFCCGFFFNLSSQCERSTAEHHSHPEEVEKWTE